MTRLENPWIMISPDDYENHMGHPSVNQQRFLSECFKKSIQRNNPQSILIIGCGTGCGLEHLDNTVTDDVTVIDINSDFLEVLKKRYHHRISGLKILNQDLNQYHFENEKYALVYAGLVFEFVDPKSILQNISDSLRKTGRLDFVLQLPSDNLPTVSSTNICSIKTLSSIAKLVDIEDFTIECKNAGLNVTEKNIQTLESGKSFIHGSAIKSGA
jgi:ubiquinone/menaquinone biosynthesis C-methylase UbiE